MSRLHLSFESFNGFLEDMEVNDRPGDGDRQQTHIQPNGHPQIFRGGEMEG